MAQVTVKQAEVDEVIAHLTGGGTFENINAQWGKARSGQMFRYDLNTGDYKFYNDLNKFARAIVRFQKTGY